ncbi:hypothetical protein Tco_0746660 [Tanacetum coccineum]
MYLTASRPDIQFAVSACSRHQVTPLTSHLNAVKRIFKYLKGRPKLGLWYPRDSPFVLEAYSDSDYAGSHGDRKSTTGGCQFLGRRLISWQCKKQTIVATSSTEAEYVAAANCCGQSTICIVKNPVFHQRTKHIEIRHHFIRDANEKHLIQVLKIHTDDNMADLLTKAFDGPSFYWWLYWFLLTEQFLLVDLLVSAGRVVPAVLTFNLVQAIIDLMAALKYRDEHNKVGFLEKSKGSTDYDQVIDFLLDSHIRYAIVSDPLIYDSLIKQFWSTASLLTSESGPPAIVAKIDGTPYTITESLVRSSLLLNDEGGIVDMSIAEIYTGMHNLGYPTEGKLTIHKNKFSPQWRFLIHTLLHCLSTKSGSWDQFGSPLAIALICLCEGRKFNWSSYIFNGMTKAEPSVPPNVPATVTETVHSHEQVSTPPRPAPTNTDAQVNEQGPFSDPNFESTSTQAHDSIPDPVPSTNVEDESLGGTFFATPPRSPAAPPKGTTSRGAADPLNLTALCTLVCEQGKKIENLESELQAHKLLFKEVMGKLVKRVKFLESKLKARRRNVFVSESDDEEAEEQDVDPLIKLAKAAASTADTSSIPANDNQIADIPTGASTHTTVFGSDTDVPTGPTFEFSADHFNKGKSPMIEEDPSIKPRSFRQLEEDRLGAEAAKKLYEEEQAALAKEQEERQRMRQEDVLNSAKYYTDDDWIRIMGQVHANQGLTADLLGPDVTEENFAERMIKVIAERRRQFETQSSVIYSTGWTLKHVKSFTDATLQEEFNKIRHAVENLQTKILRRSIKRPGYTCFTTQTICCCSSELDLNAPDTSFITVLSDDVFDASDDDTDPLFWHIFAAWEVIPTGLGDVNALYFTDKTSKYFTHLREILHLLDRQDLSKLYGMVVKHYEVNPLAGNGLILCWKLFPFSGVHVLETFSGKILYMFADTPYPLSVSLMKKMLKHKLEVEVDGVGNDMTHAISEFMLLNSLLLAGGDQVQVLCCCFNSLAPLPTGRYVVPTGRVIATDSVIVATSGYVVPAAYDISPGRIPICYDDGEDYTIAITPVLSTEEPVDSLIMEDEHLDTIPATESDEVIKSSVENLVPVLSESEGIPDSVCDVPLCNNLTPLEAFKEHFEASETLLCVFKLFI